MEESDSPKRKPYREDSFRSNSIPYLFLTSLLFIFSAKDCMAKVVEVFSAQHRCCSVHSAARRTVAFNFEEHVHRKGYNVFLRNQCS